jgi:hypothetical protein
MRSSRRHPNLANYADVAAAAVNPLEHYATFGWTEGRVPSHAFDPAQYHRRLSGRRRCACRSAAALSPVRHVGGPFRIPPKGFCSPRVARPNPLILNDVLPPAGIDSGYRPG